MTKERARILAIDDTPANLLTLGAALEIEYDLQVALSGPAGIALALQIPPDLILLDIMMPEIDGFETYKRLAAQPMLQSIPVIFVTSLVDANSELMGLSLGAVDYITKPINVTLAKQRIHNQIEREKLRKEVIRQGAQLKEEMEDRRTIENQLRKLSTAVEQSPASVAITDLKARIEYVNPRFTEVTGYSAAEVIGQNPRILQSGLTSRETLQELWGQLISGKTWKGELINKRKNGEVYWEECQIAPIFNDAGKATHYVGVNNDVTKRKQAEQAVNLLLAQQGAMLENDLIGIVRVRDRTIIWANPAFEKMLGYGKQELVGTPTRRNYPSEEAYLEFGTKSYPVITAGQVFRAQTTHVRKDGTLISVDISGSLLDKDCGETLWSFIDITEQIQGREALVEASRVLRSAQRLGHIGDWRWDLRSSHNEWSDEMFTIFGCDPTLGPVAYPEVMNFLAGESAVELKQAVCECLTTGASFQHDAKIVRPDGSHRWVIVIAEATTDIAGKVVVLQGTVQDITERKEMENSVRESAQYLQAIIQNEPECIKTVDAQGLLLHMNPAGLKMIEADSIEQVVDRPVVDLLSPEFRSAFLRMNQQVIAGKPCKMEFEVIGLKGGHRWLETHAVPMQDHGQTVQLAVTRDVTERKEMEAQIRQLAFNDSLTNLPNRRLLMDRIKQAMATSKRTGRFASLMFLDLDNFKPLNDAHGHEAGDLLLVEVASRLVSCVREIDTVARFGGDEFVVMLSELNADLDESVLQAATIAEKIKCSLAEPYHFTIRHAGLPNVEVSHHCTASIGVAFFLNNNRSADDILNQADAAMYLAKERGRNTIHIDKRYMDQSS